MNKERMRTAIRGYIAMCKLLIVLQNKLKDGETTKINELYSDGERDKIYEKTIDIFYRDIKHLSLIEQLDKLSDYKDTLANSVSKLLEKKKLLN